MTSGMSEPWLTVSRGEAPLLVSFPHTGLSVPAECAPGLVSFPLARHDADWHIDRLYAFAAELGATTVHTALSRTVIDVNRDPSGASLYPGQATTGLVPTETFDGRPLYRDGAMPDAQEIERRKQLYFWPYHAALAEEIERLRALHPRIVLYDCHSIRSVIPRLFPGELPVFNIGTNSGRSCDRGLQDEYRAHMRGEPMVVRGQRPLHRRLDHPHLWPAGRRRSRRADGAGNARLSCRRARPAALGRRIRPADPGDPAGRARSLSRLRPLAPTGSKAGAGFQRKLAVVCSLIADITVTP